MDKYELWAHRWSGDIFGVRLHVGNVTGICGPLSLVQRMEFHLGNLAYDERPAAIYRAQQHPDDPRARPPARAVLLRVLA